MRRRSVWLWLVFAVVVAVAAVGMTAVGGGHVVTKTKPGLVAILGVLRRPQTKADLVLGSQRTAALKRLSGSPVRSLVRLATVTPWGDRVFLVPVRAPTHQSSPRLPARFSSTATRRAHESRNLRLAVFAAGGAGCCITPTEIEAGHDWISGGPPNQLATVVPDGVARVSVLLPRTPVYAHSETVTATVHNNVAAFLLQRAIDSPGNVVWYGPSGGVIKRIG